LPAEGVPAWLLVTLEPAVPTNCGSLAKPAEMLSGAFLSSSTELITVTGVGAW
jgi:hypothetical protein